MRHLGKIFLASALLWSSPVTAAELQLLMFEQPGCLYCARWKAEVAPAYRLTEEGRAAPLRRLQLRDPVPEDIRLVSPPVFTPTFVLVRDGQEQGRLEGYPGEDFFWPLLDELIDSARPALE